MGLLTAQLRLAELTSYRSDLEYRRDLISSTKLDLSKQINSLVGLATDLDSESPEAKALEKKRLRLQEAEKALDLQLQRYQNQLEMINQEEQQVKQQKSEAVQRSYAA